jgi:hypothetical protein
MKIKIGKGNLIETLDLGYTLMYAWLALWALIFMGIIPRAWVETSATMAAVLMIFDAIVLFGRMVEKEKQRNRTRQTKLSWWD